jgi:hypothetical protein
MPEQKPRNGNTDQTYTTTQLPVGNAEQPSIPTFVEGFEPKERQNEPQTNHKKSRGRGFVNWLQTYSQIVLSALTFFALVVMTFQWGEMREARKLEYRAYASVKAVALEPNPMNPSEGMLIITFTNTGRTPGLNATHKASIDIRENDIREEEASFKPTDKPGSKIVLAPQIDINVTVTVLPTNLPPQPINEATKNTGSQNGKGKRGQEKPITPPVQNPSPPQIVNSAKKIYVWGIIEYDDIFGEHHQTRYCFWNIPGTASWNHAATYNSFN